MKRLFDYLFPEKTKWVDIGNAERDGNYFLIQMRATVKTNRKEFRKAPMGFINDYTVKNNLYTNSLLQIS